ncbi:LysM peptidoglycan-binding domain-containing protein [Enterococcus faecium]|uniref:LysM peptidoglycan-binding domain-containing protein n=1 Tax=Enterococcus faecium TaxID=1352 RepID=UPI000CF2CB5A|nr:LysM peptidoglycan-binding domain-containing protein [Enterococcus faecium]EGP5151426.1 LysM peptidoglycan-binding domain-containing protein [Enterococcus faecium]EGP5333614.1 LysM peptidoglycan-binding domain-containing protein [Enterococcus faecium]EGP5462063.1 LysM peptidoglycan-binding domain-containing protein [Enterococcus faecium]MCD5204398.1 LysM peptidoglycan-binding domain-containing protein [Enterococcus faecium]MCD5214540.1 LysM peptidoglycan-binding domain-containing protein [E
MKKKITITAMSLLTALFLLPINGFAAKNDQGVDWSIYQGENGRFGYAHDKFAIAQIGGYNGAGLYDQWTYSTQVASAIAQGKRAHTYIWWDVWGSQAIAKQTMDYFLPKIQTPKGSIVAIDFEGGASSNKQANTDAILYGMCRIKAAGYTPMLYSGKPFLLANAYYQQVIKEFPDSLWISAYPDYNVTPTPNWNIFPSLDGIGIYQFTSTYIAGGLDGNIDLTGITDNGYTGSDKPVTDTPATDAGEEANDTPKSEIKVGDTVKVNFSAKNWVTGEAIPQWVKGESYKVQQVNGNKVLLANILSWIDKSNVEILPDSTTVPDKPSAGIQTHVVQYGETLSSIATKYGTTYQALASLNGLSNPNMIYAGQVLKTNGTANVTRTYTVRSGDNLSSIASKLGTTYQALAQRNGLSNPNLIYPGQVLSY